MSHYKPSPAYRDSGGGEVGEMTPEKIRSLRKKTHLSQFVFATVLHHKAS
jgi:DNA-binding transcriptional regulator YiaG